MVEMYRKKEEQLIQSVRSGDRQAFGELYDKYAPLLFGVITKTIPDSKHSEEILQELFIAIWNKIASYDSNKQYLYTWMHGLAKELIVKNVSLSSNKEASQSDGTDSFVNISTGGTAINGAPSRNVLELIYFKGYTYKEAAGELNIPLASLQATIRTELNYLRGILVK